MKMLLYSILVLPGVMAAILERRRMVRGAKEYSGVSMLLALVPGIAGNWIRREFYGRTLRRCGTNVHFKFGSFCQYYSAELGNNVFIGCFNALGEVKIGDDVIIGGFVNFLSGLQQHGHQRGELPFWRQPGAGRRTVVVGSNVWIGSNACIAADLGSSVVIAAGSVVVKEVDSYTIVGGNPARKIGDVQ